MKKEKKKNIDNNLAVLPSHNNIGNLIHGTIEVTY